MAVSKLDANEDKRHPLASAPEDRRWPQQTYSAIGRAHGDSRRLPAPGSRRPEKPLNKVLRHEVPAGGAQAKHLRHRSRARAERLRHHGRARAERLQHRGPGTEEASADFHRERLCVTSGKLRMYVYLGVHICEMGTVVVCPTLQGLL